MYCLACTLFIWELSKKFIISALLLKYFNRKAEIINLYSTEKIFYQLIICKIRYSYFQIRIGFHSPFNSKYSPSFRAQLRRDIPLFTSQKSIHFKRLSASARSIQQHAKPAINNLSPTNSSTIMERNPKLPPGKNPRSHSELPCLP